MADQKIRITLSASAKGLAAEFGKAGKALKAFKGEMGMTQRAASSLSTSLKAAFAGVGLGLVTRALFQAGVEAQGLRSAFESISGSSTGAAAELDFVREASDRLGQQFYSVADSYKGIFASAKGTKMEGQGVRDLFVSIMEAGTALGTSNDALNRAFLQLSQGIGRGKFELEDLKTISEALPGVGMADFAKALGVTTAEFLRMVSAGEVVSDDFLPKLSTALHEKFGEAAAAAADNAIGAFNKFQTAWKDVQVAVAESGFMEEATESLTRIATLLKDPAVQTAIKAWAERFFELTGSVIKFVIEHGKLLAGIGAAVIVLPKLVAFCRALNAAYTVMAGIQLSSWLIGVNAAMSGVVGTTVTLGAALATTAAAAAAFFAAYKLTEWLTMRGHMQGIADASAELKRNTSKVSQEFLAISRATGVSVKSMEELDQAVADGRLRYDELADGGKGAWVAITAATRESTAAQQAAVAGATDEMKKKYKEYADQVKRLQDEIAGREQSLAEKLRAMGRSGMSDLGAWRDRKKEADEYYAAAQRAASAGNYDEAVKLADKAQAAYEDLNKEVKDGEKVQISQTAALKKSMQGVEAAGRLAITILDKQKKAATAAQEALDDQSGGELSGKLQAAKQEAEDLNKVIRDSGGDWSKVWDQMQRDGKRAIDETEREIVRLTRDREVNVYINEIVKKATGGPVGRFASGGKLPGYGGGDRIPALLEAGEFIIRKEAVSRFGSNIFHMLNSLRLPKFAAGGQVGAAGGGGVYNLNVSFAGEVSPLSQRTARDNARLLLREMQAMQKGRS